MEQLLIPDFAVCMLQPSNICVSVNRGQHSTVEAGMAQTDGRERLQQWFESTNHRQITQWEHQERGKIKGEHSGKTHEVNWRGWPTLRR